MSYNRTTEFKKDIAPLITEIKQKCAQHRIPCLLTFAVADDDEKEKTEFVTEMIDAIICEEELNNNYMSQALVALAGGRFVMPTPDIFVPTDAFTDDDEDDAESFGGVVIEKL